MDDRQSAVIPIRIGSQSRVFALSLAGRMRLLNDQWLGRLPSGETPRLLSILYSPNGVRAYHRHSVGKSWLPTAPKEAWDANSIEIEELTTTRFAQNLPKMSFENLDLKRWFPLRTLLSRCSVNRDYVEMNFSQEPAIEGVSCFSVEGRLVRPLSFLDGNALLEIAITDYFGFGRKLRIYHDGHSAAKLGIQHSMRFNSVICVTSDGTRTRFLYRPNRTGVQMATTYTASPSSLYELSKPDHDSQSSQLVRELKPNFVLDVVPRRNTEWLMLENGKAYDHGTIGAEVAYTIASKMLMTDQLLLLEPAMHGSDLVSRDGEIAIEARMLAGISAENGDYFRKTVRPHLRQMIGRLRWKLAQRAIRRGVAILCVRLGERKIVALTKEA